MDTFKGVLEQIDASDEGECKFALVHSVKVLRMVLLSGDLHQRRRQQVRSAYRMGCAALGIEEDVA